MQLASVVLRCGNGAMKNRIVLFALLCAVAALGARPALAGCNDLPRAGVDWRSCNLSGLAFPDAELPGANLRNASLSNTDFSGADLSGVDGYRVRFVEAILIGATFDGAALTDARLDRADLTGASMRDIEARNASFLFATLVDVDFTGANLNRVDFTGADLSGATWTDGIKVCAEGSRGICR